MGKRHSPSYLFTSWRSGDLGLPAAQLLASTRLAYRVRQFSDTGGASTVSWLATRATAQCRTPRSTDGVPAGSASKYVTRHRRRGVVVVRWSLPSGAGSQFRGR